MWLAKGRCACGGPIARLAALPGACLATCNLCHERSALLAWRPPRAALVVVAGILAACFVLAPVVKGPAPAWASIEQQLVVERGIEGYRYHLATVALDADGSPVAFAEDELPLWSFATGASLVRTGELAWWACAAPPACAFDVERDDIVYFTPADPDAGLARAYDPRKDAALVEVAGTWSRFADTSEGLRVVISR